MAELTLTGLRVIFEVARCGSISAAADALGYTQSAVSRQVAATEKVVGTALFARHARGVRPTTAGEALARHAGQVLDGVAAARQELAGLRDRLAGRLVVGGFPTASSVLLPRAIARLSAAHPGLEVRLTAASTPAQLTALRRGRLEVAVLATGAGLPEYDLDGLRLTELRGAPGAGVAVDELHPFAARPSVSPADLADQTWIVGPRTSDGPEFGAWPGIAEPRIAFTAREWPTRLGLVAAGLGIAVVPGIAAEALPSGVVWVRVRDGDGGGLGRAIRVATSAEPGAAATAMVRALRAEVVRLGRRLTARPGGSFS